MTNPTLPKRLSEATGADRELDLAIADHFPGVTVPFHNIGRWDAPEWVNPASTHGRYVPFYTASLDAALALVERIDPGSELSLLQQAIHSVIEAEAFERPVGPVVARHVLMALIADTLPNPTRRAPAMGKLTDARARVLGYMAVTGCEIVRHGNSTGWTGDAFQWPVATATFEALIARAYVEPSRQQTSNSTIRYSLTPAGRAALNGGTDA